MGRRFDPERRQRIIDAAIRVVERKGIAALSHRVVAAEADVPLGSTTYHFATLDDLLIAALRQINSEPGGLYEEWARNLEGVGPLADRIVGLIEAYVAEERRGRGRLEYELYLAALRRDALRPVAAECLDAMVEVLGRHTRDVATARMVVAAMDGLMLQQLLTGRRLERAEMRAALARVLG